MGEMKGGELQMERDVMDKYGMKPIWIAISDIYLEFGKICAKHNLRYYASGGTALGAVRHNGFIPWDDDIDIVMPRRDYEEFLRVAEKELPHHLKIVSRHNTPEFLGLFAKIQETRKTKVEEVEREVGHILSNGLFIDFYPMDGYPSGARCLWTKLRLWMKESLWRYRFEQFSRLSPRGKLAWLIGMMASPFNIKLKTKVDFMDVYDAILQENTFEDSVYVADVGYFKNVFAQPKMAKSFFKASLPHRFENFTIMLPSEIDAYCKNKFGKDFMKLPPEESRRSTHVRDFHFPWWLGPTTDKRPYLSCMYKEQKKTTV